MRYIILNFAYGFGPFLRTTELGLVVKNLLERSGRGKFGLIVPLAYGDEQKRIMFENFSETIKFHPNEIFLDKKLGACLQSIFYGKAGYEVSLRAYIKNHASIEKEIQKYFSEGLVVEDFWGGKKEVKKNEIAMEINRCPRISFGIQPSYYTSFAYISTILEKTLEEEVMGLDEKIIKKALPLIKNVEEKSHIHFISEPGTFSYLDDLRDINSRKVGAPPNTALPPPMKSAGIKEGIYTTVTGIPGLNKLFEDVHKLGLKIYTNKPDDIPHGEFAQPNALLTGKIILHFARSGWGSVWLSQLSGVPFIAPPYRQKDDPEIYFNNVCVEKMSLGKIYHGEGLQEIMDFAGTYKKNIKKINKGLVEKFGTLNGIIYTAEKIVSNFIRNYD